ncbi:ABC transporter-related protein [Chloroherpeton thalassium ATCC 35110]|uniref:ABC transporter-related protein n=1 Tax=Chloroherpeton thalassium (strain ATCC 35110 / GB-78) TaxID=517418 RepID=B3QYA9_CHLT3|nr:ABC transporter ATP-binding protein [Chloroherpeton thalassium]ACF15075.1 ABC transporter-related protein [Chloroherpeton thalassium ATCC 35110]
MELKAEQLKKQFGNRIVFQGLSFETSSPVPLAITGANGSGKSTLLKVLAGLERATSGIVRYSEKGKDIPIDQLRLTLGFVAPYLNLYGNLSGYENILFSIQAKNLNIQNSAVDELFEYFQLRLAKHQLLKTYSSGMIQRVRFIQALIANPQVLFLDEPTTTLDTAGKSLFWNYVLSAQQLRLLIIASNDEDDLKHCKHRICMESFKK